MTEQQINIVDARNAIVKNLQEHGFRPTGADQSDFQFGSDPSLRFKVGTVYGEVTVTIWKYANQVDAIRVLSDAQVVEANHKIDGLIHAKFSRTRTIEEPASVFVCKCGHPGKGCYCR